MTTGRNLLFIVSQPRAGSTLLQRILGCHSAIHTTAEPWIMLHPLYALRSTGLSAEYGASLAHTGLEEFLATIPSGRECYMEGVRRMYSHLYDCALEASGKQYFLDKTPRYYLVAQDLLEVFPEARVILLLRNPLAVLCSILSTWVKRRWLVLGQWEQDLLDAPRLLLQAREALGDRAIVVRYEDLVADPYPQVQRLCERLHLEFLPEMIEYGRSGNPGWKLGDPTGVGQRSRPDASRASGWAKALSDPQVWRLAHDYLELLGPSTLNDLGYDYEGLWEEIQRHRISDLRLLATLPLSWALGLPAKRLGRLARRAGVIASTVYQQDPRTSLAAVQRKVQCAVRH